MSDDAASTSNQMRLRYAGRCRACGVDLPAGTTSAYDRATKTVAFLECALEPTPTGSGPSVPETRSTADVATEPESVPPKEEPDVVVGTAGASAEREHERRKNKRETGVGEANPRLGGLILALSDDPQSTKAWAVGGRGEELLGQRLDGPAEPGFRVLYDRRIPGVGRHHVGAARSEVAIDLAAVTDAYDQDKQHVVVDLIDDPVVPGAHPPLAAPTDELRCLRWPRVGCEQRDRSNDPVLGDGVELADLLVSGRRVLDAVGAHPASPRSANSSSWVTRGPSSARASAAAAMSASSSSAARARS